MRGTCVHSGPGELRRGAKMGGRALSASLEETEDVARRDRASRTAKADSPAIRLLDAMRAGDDPGVLAVCGETTTVSADNMRWSCRGRDEIQDMLEELRRRFPGITFESRSRHVGFGLVIDEARIQDVRENEDEDANVVEVVKDDEAPAEVPAVEEISAKHLSIPETD